nr:MAG TPA: DNA adenine methylase [Caudoviricetes sp.]
MNYGMPYMGSKSKIAKWIVDMLPAAHTWVEPFAGGCAVTHAAILSGKYKRFIINDITDSAKVFVDAINGKFKNENRWISRSDFLELKDEDAYVRLCFSFGNDQKTYCYSREIEPYKRAFHYAVMFNDFKPFEELGIQLNISKTFNSDYERRIHIKKHLIAIRKDKHAGDLESLERLQSLQPLQLDYRDVPIPKNDYIVYCDPPYVNTNAYLSSFNHDEFYKWALSIKNLFISEYEMPEPFKRIEMRRKTCTFSALKNDTKKEEGIWVNKKYAERNTSLSMPIFNK